MDKTEISREGDIHNTDELFAFSSEKETKPFFGEEKP